MKEKIDIKPKRAKIKFQNNLPRTATNVDRFCLESDDGNDSVSEQFYMIDHAQKRLFTVNNLDADDFSHGESEKIAIFGDLYECSCLDVYNRFAPGNMRLHYENAIVKWCQVNGKASVTLLSIGSGGLLQEAILAERLKSLGITPSFICVDINYPSDANLEQIRQRKLRGHQVDPSDFHEWMLTPSKPIMLYHLRCMRAIAAFKKHADLQTFCSIADLALALEQKMIPSMPDLVIAIDILAEFHTPIDTRVATPTAFESMLQGYLGDKKYAFEYAVGEDCISRDWGWYNFTAILLSSGLLKHNPSLPSLASAYGMVKSFKGVDETRCYIPQSDGNIKRLGLNDSDPEVFVIYPIYAEVMRKNDLLFHSFPHRVIIVTPQMTGRLLFPEHEHRLLSLMFGAEKADLTEIQYLFKLKEAFDSVHKVTEKDTTLLPYFVRFKAMIRHAYETSDYAKVAMVAASTSVCLAAGYRLYYQS